MSKAVSPVCICGGKDFQGRHVYEQPPGREIRFQFSSGGKYRREILQCRVCGHFLSVHDMDIAGLYEGDYVSANYGEKKGILETFQRINGLDPSQSDNVSRVRRIHDFLKAHAPDTLADPERSVLDVGSGLCVFLHRMKEAGWKGTALDPDERSVAHAREVVGVEARQGDFMKMEIAGAFDLVTFNRVLEHVPDPAAMLIRAGGLLKKGGWVYVEVPDGEMAWKDPDGFEREEFFVDHLHVFSEESLKCLVKKSGLQIKGITRVREPSGKYTLYTLAAT